MKNMNTNYKYTINKFVLNKMLHHVGMSRIIEINQQLEYDIEIHNPDWITGGPWYSIYICKKLHGEVFEKYIRSARTDRYNHMYSIDTHEKYQP